MFLADEPIPSSADDILGRKPFADALAQAILAHQDKTPLVIGLLGPWGTGKSSIIQMTKEAIEAKRQGQREEDQPIVIHFNPWMVADQNTLVNQFFDHMITALGKWNYAKGLKKASRLLKTYSEVFSPLGLVPTPGGKIAGAATRAGAFLAKGLAWFSSYAESVEQQKDNIDKALREQSHKIIMFIDEIDRLSSQEVRQLFQVVKSVANFSQVIYILAFDNEVVAKQIADLHPGDGAEFLEKIVQVPFFVPKIAEDDVHRFLKKSILALFEKWQVKTIDADHLRDIFYYGLRVYVTNLREAKRYLNVLAFTGHIAKNIFATDLVAITALQVFEPAIYQEVRENKDFLTCEAPPPGQNDKMPMQEAVTLFNNIVKKQRSGSEAAPGSILRLLFPKTNLAAVQRGGTLEFTPDVAWRLAGRICDPATFDLFFKLSLPKGEYGLNEIEAVMAVVGDRTAFAQQVGTANREGRIRKLLENYHRYLVVGRVPASAVPVLLDVFVDLGDTFQDQTVEDEREAIFRLDLWSLTVEIVKLTSHVLNDDVERPRAVLEAVRNAKESLFLPILVFQNVLASPEAEKEMLREKILTWANDGRLLRHLRIGPILNYWESLGGKEQVDRIVEQVLQDEAALLNLLRDYVTDNRLSGLDYYSKPEFKFSLDSLRKRLDARIVYDKLRELLRRPDFQNRPKRVKEFIHAFLRQMTEYKPEQG